MFACLISNHGSFAKGADLAAQTFGRTSTGRPKRLSVAWVKTAPAVGAFEVWEAGAAGGAGLRRSSDPSLGKFGVSLCSLSHLGSTVPLGERSSCNERHAGSVRKAPHR